MCSLVEGHLYARMDEDYELNEIFFGKLAAPTPGTPGAAGTGMDGIRTIIDRAGQQRGFALALLRHRYRERPGRLWEARSVQQLRNKLKLLGFATG